MAGFFWVLLINPGCQRRLVRSLANQKQIVIRFTIFFEFGRIRIRYELLYCQRSFNWQSTAFVMRGLWVRLPSLAFQKYNEIAIALVISVLESNRSSLMKSTE